MNGNIYFSRWMSKVGRRVPVPRRFLTDFLRGHSRVILEQAQEKPGVAKALKIFGIQWR
jgi:hypothetical protein